MTRPSREAPAPSVAQFMRERPETIAVFARHRMLCIGCPFARFCTVADACRAHGEEEADFNVALRAAR